jgi:glyoxylase-like metal-dependent hydrolase (beta-lactamase superfamily II)
MVWPEALRETGLYFRLLYDELSGELTYLLADPLAREAVLVDPRGRDLPVLTALLSERDLRLRWVLRTHHHDDHHPLEAQLLGQLGAPRVQGDADASSHPVQDRQVLPFGDELVQVLSTPGHTKACLSFAWRDRLFCGGLLAVQTCPHQPRPSAPEQLWDSVTQRIFTLPNETLLFAGHDRHARAVSTVLEQRRWHPLFAKLTRDEFLAHHAIAPSHEAHPALR